MAVEHLRYCSTDTAHTRPYAPDGLESRGAPLRDDAGFEPIARDSPDGGRLSWRDEYCDRTAYRAPMVSNTGK